jgi:hypothetical protein
LNPLKKKLADRVVKMSVFAYINRVKLGNVEETVRGNRGRQKNKKQEEQNNPCILVRDTIE